MRIAQATNPRPASSSVDLLAIENRQLTIGKDENLAGSVPGEVLVKFKSESAMQRAMAASRAIADSRTPQFAAGSQIEAILARHSVKRALPLMPTSQQQKGVSSAQADEALASLGRLVRLVSTTRSDEATYALMAELSRQPEVEYAVPNMIYELHSVPNDPYYSSSGAWGQDYKDLWGLHNIEAEQAWDTTQGEGVVVAVIDTGVDYKHNDLKKNIWKNEGEMGRDSSGRDKSSNGVDDDGNGYVDDWRGWDFQDDMGSQGINPPDNNPMDDVYHGTHVAGTIAATGNNKKGIIGVAPKAKIMALKVFHAFDGLVGTNSASLAEAIVYAANNGARVMNASWGGRNFATNRPVEEAIDFAVDVKGVVMAVSAGNSNRNVEDNGSRLPALTHPAAYEKVITVAASDHLDRKAFFSNFGPKIDVIAPGGGDEGPSEQITSPENSVLSLLSSKAPLNENGQKLIVDGKYLRLAGTSMSAPHVAGLAALILSKNPHFTVEQVRQAIRLGADDVGAAGFDSETGYGRINAARSVAIANPPAPSINDVKNSGEGAGLNLLSTIASQGFTQWRLEYGKAELGDMPASWTEIATSTDNINMNLQTLWNTASVEDGVYVLRLRVEDNQGRQLDDRTRIGIKDGRLAPTKALIWLDTFREEIEPEDNDRTRTQCLAFPYIAIIYPYFKLPSKVELFDRGQWVADLTLNPSPTLRNSRDTYATREATWLAGSVGEAELRVVVEGENGEKFTSHPKRIKVLPNAPPSLALYRISVNGIAPGKLDLQVSSSDPDGGTAPPGFPCQPGVPCPYPCWGGIEGIKVEVYNHGQLIATLSRRSLKEGGGYRFTWENLAAGTYSIRVVATDKDGLTTRSLPINFTVTPQ